MFRKITRRETLQYQEPPLKKILHASRPWSLVTFPCLIAGLCLRLNRSPYRDPKAEYRIEYREPGPKYLQLSFRSKLLWYELTYMD